MRKIKLTYLINDMAIGGAENLLSNVVRELDESLFKCTVVYLYGKNEFPETKSAEYVSLGLEAHNIFRNTKHFRAVWKYFSENRCDILHTHLCYADTYGQLVGTLQNIPVVYSTIHNIVEWPREPRNVRTAMEDHLLRNITRVIAVSDSLKQEVATERHCPPEKITTLYNGLDLELFAHARDTREQVRAELGMDRNAPLVLCTAQFRPEKRHDLLLPAFELMLKQTPNAKLLLVGSSGQKKEEVTRWIAERNLRNSILIRSGDRHVVARYCGAADIFTMHSEHEGFPIALNEAMASGLPVVVPKISVFEEAVRDGVDGYLFPFNDSNAHAEALLALWRNIQDGNVFWSGTAPRIRHQFSIQTHVQHLTALYREDLARRRNVVV